MAAPVLTLAWAESVELDARRLARFCTTNWHRLIPPPRHYSPDVEDKRANFDAALRLVSREAA
jgi:hypothetical protein